MKRVNMLIATLLATMLSATFVACTDDDDDSGKQKTEFSTYSYDIWIALDRHGGMGRDVQTLVRSLPSLDATDQPISFEGEGTEVNSVLTLENIVHDSCYYQVPVSGDRFLKYYLQDNRIVRVKERPFGTNSYSPRKYTHAWIDDQTLIIMAASGDCRSMLWTKLNATDMTIIDEGQLDFALPADYPYYPTSGILTYRPTDHRLVFFYYGKNKANGREVKQSPMCIATIDAATMQILSNVQTRRAKEMAGSAYGELLQKCTVCDESGDIYLACLDEAENDYEDEVSHLLRIRNGETDFDPDFDGFCNQGKLMAMEYLGNGKVLGYARDNSLGTSIDSYSHYYTVIDLPSATHQPLSFQGERLPYSGGRFSSRMTVAGGKAYIGLNPKDTNPCIYVYDIKTATIAKGAEIKEGYYFEQIRALKR